MNEWIKWIKQQFWGLCNVWMWTHVCVRAHCVWMHVCVRAHCVWMLVCVHAHCVWMHVCACTLCLRNSILVTTGGRVCVFTWPRFPGQMWLEYHLKTWECVQGNKNVSTSTNCAFILLGRTCASNLPKTLFFLFCCVFTMLLEYNVLCLVCFATNARSHLSHHHACRERLLKCPGAMSPSLWPPSVSLGRAKFLSLLLFFHGYYCWPSCSPGKVF